MGHDAVQSDVVSVKPGQGGLPQPEPVALAAKLRADDLKAHKPVAPGVGNR
jgi:hypothetical protein